MSKFKPFLFESQMPHKVHLAPPWDTVEVVNHAGILAFWWATSNLERCEDLVDVHDNKALEEQRRPFHNLVALLYFCQQLAFWSGSIKTDPRERCLLSTTFIAISQNSRGEDCSMLSSQPLVGPRQNGATNVSLSLYRSTAAVIGS